MSKTVYVISDLHLCAGEVSDWMEDFRPKQESIFCQWISSLVPADSCVVINGDFIDFVQIPPFQDSHIPDHLLWDEGVSCQKLQPCFDAHKQLFDALNKFVSKGGILDLTVGNHDLDLIWKKVQDELRVRIGGDANNVRFFNDYVIWHRVWIEHGRQFSPENNISDASVYYHKYPDTAGGVNYLERIWGTDFMLRFYNDLEKRFPFADNVKPMVKLIYHGIKKGWIRFDMVHHFLKFLKSRGIPPLALGPFLLNDGDLSIGKALFMDSPFAIMDDNSAKPMVDKALKNLSQDNIDLIKEIVDEPPDTYMALFSENRETRAARKRLDANPDVDAVVFGHTHDSIAHSVGDLDGKHFNTGSWIAHLDLKDEKVKQKIKQDGGISQELLSDMSSRFYKTEFNVAVISESNPGKVDFRTL